MLLPKLTIFAKVLFAPWLLGSAISCSIRISPFTFLVHLKPKCSG
jgi:hypothetical protein